MKARRSWTDIIPNLRDRKGQPRLLYPANLSITIDRETKVFHCCVQLDQQGKCNHQFFLKQLTQAAFLFKFPASLVTSVFFPLQPQPHPHQSSQVTSPHQAGLLSQSGIKGGPSTKHGLVYCLEQISVRLARDSRMASHNFDPPSKKYQSIHTVEIILL